MSTTPAINDKTLKTFIFLLYYGEGVGLQMSGYEIHCFMASDSDTGDKLNSNVVDTGD